MSCEIEKAEEYEKKKKEKKVNQGLWQLIS